MAGGHLIAGRYLVQRELGRGATGRVVLALDRAHADAPRALKLVGPEALGRLGWEFELLRKLAHPNLTAVHELLRLERALPELDLLEGTVVLVSDVAPGEPSAQLATSLQREPEALLGVCLQIGEAVARALAALHGLGLVHGDVKPDNIVVQRTQEPAALRCTLVDLGLSGPAGERAAISGTPAYMAPELFRGERGFGSDLYALGATLHRLLRSATAAQEPSAGLADHLRAALRPAAEREALPSWTPAPLRALLASLLEPDPSARLASAPELRVRLASIAQTQGVALGPLTGGGADDVLSNAERAAQISALPWIGPSEVLTTMRDALDRGGLCVVRAAEGSGRSRLVRQAVGGLQHARVLAGRSAPTYRRVDRLPEGALGADTVLHVTDADATTAEQTAALLRAAEVEGCFLSLVLERSTKSDAPAIEVALEPLAEGDVRRLLEHALPGARVGAPLVREAMAASGGLAGRLCNLIASALRAGSDPTRPQALRAIGAAEGGDLGALSERARPLAELIAIAGGELPANAAAAALGSHAKAHDAYRELLCAGLATIDGPRLCLRRDLSQALRAALSVEQTQALAEHLPESELTDVGRAYLACTRGEQARALALFLDEIKRLRLAGDPEQAAQCAEEGARALGAHSQGVELLALERADALRAQGQYRLALAVLHDGDSARVEVARAELERLLGDRERARAAAERALALDADQPRTVVEAQAVLARLAYEAGDIDQAAARAQRALDIPQQGAVSLRATEVQLRVLLHRGELAAVRRELASALERARALRAPGAEARLLSLSGELARQQGDGRAAASAFVAAFELAQRAGEQHAAAAFLHNVGAQRLDAGEPGPAIAALRDSARRLARLGRDADLGRVLYNLGQAAQLIGADDIALSSAQQALAAARRAEDAATTAYAEGLLAEQKLLSGDRKAVAALLSTPLDLDALSAEVAACAAARRACLHLALGEQAAAERWLAASEQAARGAPPEAELEPLLARAQLELDAGRLENAALTAERAHGLAQRAGSFEARLRAGLLSARAQRSVGRAALASARYSEVRGLLDEAARGLQPAERARLRAIDGYRVAFEAMPTAAPATSGEDARFRALAGMTKRLLGEQRPARLRELVLAAALELSGAERGYLVLKDADGIPRVRAAQGLERKELERDEHVLSRSIVTRVLNSGRPLRTMDAATDDRLSGAASVHALSLRSVLAVALQSRGQVHGAIYLEDRLRPFAFGEVELALLSDLADLASLALESVQLLRAERRAARRLSALRAKLAARVESQAIEIGSLKRERGQDTASPHGIVAHARGMQRVLATLPRIARADVPVLISGESGTGKELIARAIHNAGERRTAPFVTENCGAIPEPLLESALFGHVRGAFTGADRRHLGLFEVADGGTLLLDEIGEMSPAMQAKLLRVLQDGEVRPVGGERSRRVDVRVIAATHRDLPAMVEAGRFRDDLFYRLAVMRIELPPLRDRPDDIAPLAAHFLAQHARGRAVELSGAALAVLCRHLWPGNVRQLENEIRRALVLADGVILPEHLSSELLQGPRGPSAERLDMRARIDELERNLIKEALASSEGNQTRAARMLGVSRFGLQKMMRRLNG